MELMGMRVVVRLLFAAVMALAAGGGSLPVPAARAALSAQTPRAARAVSAGVSFEVNRGQAPGQVRYLAHLAGSTLYLTRSGATIVSDTARPSTASNPLVRAPRTASVRERIVTLEPTGMSRHVRIVAQDRLPGRVNYFIGNNPRRWHTNIPTYGSVEFQGVYPGIDLRFHSRGTSLEYDWLLAAGADPARIRLAVRGPGHDVLDGSGRLLIGGQVVQHSPAVFQQAGSTRVRIAGRYVLHGTQLHLRLGRYDHSRPLLVDPVLQYSSYLGGADYDIGYGIAVDVSDHAYVVGEATSATFPTTGGALSRTYGGSNDGFVTEFSSDGSTLLYSTFLGGDRDDAADAVAVDTSGDAYVTGLTFGGFPTTTGVYQPNQNGVEDVFVTKLNPTGSGLLYSTYLGGGGDDEGRGIAINSAGNAFVTGVTDSSATTSGVMPGYPTTAGAYQIVNNGGYDSFVTELSTDAKSLIYSTYLGGTNSDLANGIVLNGTGNAFITGVTYSSNYPTTAGAFQRISGGDDAFITKLSANGASLVYSTFLGGTKLDEGNGIALDSSGNAYVAGITYSSDFPTTSGAFDTMYGGTLDAFVTKLNAAGSKLTYSSFLGNAASTQNAGIAVDTAGDAFVTGQTTSSTLPVTADAYQSAFHGVNDAYLFEFNPGGTAVTYGTYLGGGGEDDGYGIATDPAGNVFLTGYTTSSTANGLSPPFPTTNSAFQFTAQGSGDAFVSEFKFIGATATHIAARAVRRFGGRITFTWRVSNPAGVVGFNLYAGHMRLNHRLIAVHHSARYRYMVTAARSGPYTLHTVLTNGGQEVLVIR